MRHVLLLVVVSALGSHVPFSGASAADALQRCVWSCLASSSGNDDPRYHACVQRVCLDGGSDATRQDATHEAVPITRETIMFVQRTLSSLGHDPGPVDGISGPRTDAAIASFRRARGLPGSGIDRDLLEALRQ